MYKHPSEELWTEVTKVKEEIKPPSPLHCFTETMACMAYWRSYKVGLHKHQESFPQAFPNKN